MQNILAGHTNSYHTYGLDEALQGIAAAGFEYVELSAVDGYTEHVPIDATDEQIAEIKGKLDQLGLKVSALSGHSDLTTAEGVVVGKKAIDLCTKLGVSLMNTAIGGHYSEDEDKDAFMGYVHELADYAAEQDVVIGLEVHGDIMASGALSIPIIKEIGRDNVGINYDTANCVFYADVQAVDDISATVPYLVHVHLKDSAGGKGVWNFPAVGEGLVDFSGILNLLEEEGYTGPFSVEIEFQGEPFPPLAEVDRSMKVSYETLSNLGLS
ncbi:MAG: sugar phosphate isomerase/epimerase family protein [Chloroflexota bacterium]|nr:sugar phosphate isomerase/epimerase family protein [Chloroflexota bacterium]